MTNPFPMSEEQLIELAAVIWNEAPRRPGEPCISLIADLVPGLRKIVKQLYAPVAVGEVKDIADFLRAKSQEFWLGFGACAKFGEAADLLTNLSVKLAQVEGERDWLKAQSLDNAVRAHGWMVMHDALQSFIQARPALLSELIDADPRPPSPKPSDVPDIISQLTAAQSRIAELIVALANVTASLVAAISLLERGGKKAAPSDKMFVIMLEDYRKSVEAARNALKGT